MIKLLNKISITAIIQLIAYFMIKMARGKMEDPAVQ